MYGLHRSWRFWRWQKLHAPTKARPAWQVSRNAFDKKGRKKAETPLSTTSQHTLRRRKGTRSMLAVTTNVSSLIAQDNLGKTTNSLQTSLQRLSSGLKVNTGADGPAALVISQQQQAQIAGLQAAIDNTSKAISLVQTAEGALNEINALLTQ